MMFETDEKGIRKEHRFRYMDENLLIHMKG